MEVQSIRLRFCRHARHEGQLGSWFGPATPRQGSAIFVYDDSVARMTESVSSMPARVTAINEGPYVMPVSELAKAEKARREWLEKRFVTVANKIHREARMRPDDDYRFHSLHPREGEWIARFHQKSTTQTLDMSLSDIRSMLQASTQAGTLQDLFTAEPNPSPYKIPDKDLLHAVRELRAIGPVIRTQNAQTGAHIS